MYHILLYIWLELYVVDMAVLRYAHIAVIMAFRINVPVYGAI
jgi:hypothetical protein